MGSLIRERRVGLVVHGGANAGPVMNRVEGGSGRGEGVKVFAHICRVARYTQLGQ